MSAKLTALAIEGPLPAYAATIGEVDEVKREKDEFFTGLAARAGRQAADAGLEIDVEVRPGHPADLISRVAAEGSTILSCSAIVATSSATTSSAPPPIGLPSMLRAR